MTIGASIILGVVGAILRYAVSDNVDNVDLRMIGLILMIAAVVGFVIGIFVEFSRRRPGDVVVTERIVEEPPRF